MQLTEAGQGEAGGRPAATNAPKRPLSRSTIHMTGYIMFLKGLSEYQQRAEIGRLAFSERWSGSSLEKDILKDQAVVTFSETLGINPRFWEFQLRHYAEEPEVVGPPVFRTDQCLAPFSFHYEHLNQILRFRG